MNFFKVGKVRESVAITERDIDDSMVSEGRHARQIRGFLTSAWPSSRNEDCGIFSCELSSSPKLAGGVPESLIEEGDGQIFFIERRAVSPSIERAGCHNEWGYPG